MVAWQWVVPRGIFGECYESVRRHCMGMDSTITECQITTTAIYYPWSFQRGGSWLNLTGHVFCTCFFYWASRWWSWWVITDFYVASTRINGWFLLCSKSFGQFGHFWGLTRYFQEANVYNNVNISLRPIFMTFWLIRCDQSKSLDTSKQKWTENVYNSSWMWNLIWLKKWVKPKY